MEKHTSSTSSRHHAVRLLTPSAAAVAAIAVGVLAVTANSAGSARAAAAGVAASVPPATVVAARIPELSVYLRPGTVVPSSSVGRREFVNAKDGFSVASSEKLGADYPVTTVNGGQTWRIAGPALHVPAANAGAIVTLWGMASTNVYYAYAGPGGAYTVDVTPNAGRTWWRASFPAVYAVVPYDGSPNHLLAFTPWPGAYYTTDGGRVWHYAKSALSAG